MTNPDDLAFTNDIFLDSDGRLEKVNNSITKLEYFACAAMQGLLANNIKYMTIAEDAVDAARKLIEELNKQQ